MPLAACVLCVAVAAAGCGGEADAARRARNAAAARAAADIGRADEKAGELEAEAGRLLAQIRSMEESNKEQRHVLYHNLGCIYRQTRRFNEAESAFLEALRLDPDAADTHLGIGILYDADLRRMDKANEHFERYLKLSPDSPRAPEVRGWLDRLKKQAKDTGATR